MASGFRSPVFDAFKGIAMTAIVLGHTVIGNAMASDINGDPNALTMLGGFLFSGLMMFFLISGYYYKPERSYAENMKRRLLQLGVAFVVLTILLPTIVFVSEVLCGKNLDFADLGKYIVGMLVGPYFMENIGMFNEDYFVQFYSVVKNFYFIQTLLVTFMVYYAIADKCVKNPLRVVLITIACALLMWGVAEYQVRLPFYAELVPLALPFMLVGGVLKVHNFAEYLETGYKTAKYWAIAIGLMFVGFCILVASPVKLDIMKLEYGYYGAKCVFPFFFSMMFSGIGLVMLVSALHFVPRVLNALASYGKYTLYIFVFHLFYVKWIASFYMTESTNPLVTVPFSSIGESFVYFVLGIVLPMLTMLVVERLRKAIRERKQGNVS